MKPLTKKDKVHCMGYTGGQVLGAREWLKKKVRTYPIEMGGEREGIINLIDEAFDITER